MPLRGACVPYLSQSKANVFNKFSVKYWLRLKVIVSKPKEEEAEARCEVLGGVEEIMLWR
jgi:hypothetical protein